MVIIIGQVLMFLASGGNMQTLSRAALVWDKVLEGEVWRLVTFLLVPPSASVLFLLIALYMFYLFGSSLEQIWGEVRYNAFLMLGAVLTIAAAGVVHDQPVTGAFLGGSVFLAFATYNPNFEILLAFILPVKIKYLAYLAAAGYVMGFLFGPLPTRLMVLASIRKTT